MEELTLQQLYELTDLIGTKTDALQNPRLASPNQRSAIAMMLPYATITDVMVSGARVLTRSGCPVGEVPALWLERLPPGVERRAP